jgi:HK97 family phage portal protein
MFPEIRRSLKEMFSGSEPIALNLQKKSVSFDSVSVQWYLENGYNHIASLLMGGAPAWSGETVNLETALGHSVVWACNRIISETIGYLPAVLGQMKGNAHRDASEHPMYSAMRYQPNDELTAHEFSSMLTGHALLQGGGYSQIIRRSGTGVAIELRPLMPSGVFPDREKTGQKRLCYVIKEPGIADKTYTVQSGKPQDILHLRGMGWDGIRGYSVIQLGRQSIGTAIAAERHLARFFASGGRLPYVLELQKLFPDEHKFNRFREDWERIYADSWRTPVTEPWVKYAPINGTSMRDSQGVENRQFAVSEICRWFGVNPPMVYDLSRATFANIEQLALDFVKFTIQPWMDIWEQAFRRCVLTPDERAQGYYLKHDERELLRGDFKSRMESYASALQNGHWNVDEVRADQGKDPLPNDAGQAYRFQLNMQTTPGTGTPTVVEQGIISRGSTPPAAGADKAFDEWLERQLSEYQKSPKEEVHQ